MVEVAGSNPARPTITSRFASCTWALSPKGGTRRHPELLLYSYSGRVNVKPKKSRVPRVVLHKPSGQDAVFLRQEGATGAWSTSPL